MNNLRIHLWWVINVIVLYFFGATSAYGGWHNFSPIIQPISYQPRDIHIPLKKIHNYFGYSATEPFYWEDALIANNDEIKKIANAAEAGWVQKNIYYLKDGFNYTVIPIHEQYLQPNRAYWLTALQDNLVLILPNVVGSSAEDQYIWLNVNLDNGIETKTILNASKAGWLQSTIYYFNVRKQYNSFIPGDSDYIYPWVGYTLYTTNNNMTLRFPPDPLNKMVSGKDIMLPKLRLDNSISLKIFLKKGWNVISIPIKPPLRQGYGVNTTLKSINGKYSIVAHLEEIWHEGSVSPTLKSITPNRGYRIKMKEASVLYLKGSRFQGGIHLYKGWNLISYIPKAALSVRDALSSIEGKYLKVGTEIEGADGELQFIPVDTMEFGKGYLINMKEPAELYYPIDPFNQTTSVSDPNNQEIVVNFISDTDIYLQLKTESTLPLEDVNNELNDSTETTMNEIFPKIPTQTQNGFGPSMESDETKNTEDAPIPIPTIQINTTIKKGDVTIKKGDVTIKEGDVTIKEGDVTIKEGDVTIKEGDVTIKEGDVTIKEGDVTKEPWYKKTIGIVTFIGTILAIFASLIAIKNYKRSKEKSEKNRAGQDSE